MAAPATPQPLVTPELLEMILSKLPLRDLLLAQRTCKAWHVLISDSPTLQALLYFRPAIPSSLPKSTSSYTLNPLLSSAFPFIFNPNKILSKEEAADWDILWGNKEDPPTPTPNMDTCVKAFLYTSWNRRPEVWRRKEASWRRMLVSDPPVKTVVWRMQDAGMMGQSWREVVVGFGSEVRETAGEKVSGKGPPHLKLDKETVDCAAEDGLRMHVLYDYLFGNICSGDIPGGLKVDFAFGKYPSLDEVIKYAEHEFNLSLENLIKDEEAGPLTLLVEMFWSRSCVDYYNDEAYPQFKSEAFKWVDVGPLAMVKSAWWD
ncbi:auxilin-like clathrin-binding protein required for normal clathrin function [Kalmusia sp. IMI 367209]|nr:auxilin-like clathrin-binding protein required for normal clathrin function [Kalmusia sp. IMI 367209]